MPSPRERQLTHASFFYTGFINGGGISLIYGYFFCFLGSLATCASIAEMASMSVIR